MDKLIHPRTSICPLCGGAVSLQIISLRRSFDCPSCRQALRVPKSHELTIRILALVLGFVVARGIGFESLLVFCVGLMVSPVLVIPVWRMWVTLIQPVLISAPSAVTTLSLHQ